MISTLASIHPNARIGNNVIIDPFVVVHDNVVVGDDTHIMSHAVLMPYTRVGKKCRSETPCRDQNAADRGADYSRSMKHRTIERDRRLNFFTLHQFRNERRERGHFE